MNPQITPESLEPCLPLPLYLWATLPQLTTSSSAFFPVPECSVFLRGLRVFAHAVLSPGAISSLPDFSSLRFQVKQAVWKHSLASRLEEVFLIIFFPWNPDLLSGTYHRFFNYLYFICLPDQHLSLSWGQDCVYGCSVYHSACGLRLTIHLVTGPMNELPPTHSPQFISPDNARSPQSKQDRAGQLVLTSIGTSVICWALNSGCQKPPLRLWLSQEKVQWISHTSAAHVYRLRPTWGAGDT